jgi:signal transduction histidine kinase
MAAQITHEVRNPLASIGLYAELLGDEIADRGAEPRRLVQSIISEVDRLTEITETYLRFARLPRPKLEREDLGAIVTGVLEFARAELSQAGIALDLVVAPGLPDVAADEAQLRQALLNLLRNAREAMPGGGPIDVSVAAEGMGVVVDVDDRGGGVPESIRARVFDPFFSTKGEGTGLGLAITRHIVESHGGSVTCQPREGGGTRFRVTLPIAPAKSVWAVPGAGA